MPPFGQNTPLGGRDSLQRRCNGIDADTFVGKLLG
jgi:hypothetical protein